MKKLTGIQGAPGIAIGDAYLHHLDDPWIDYRQISGEEVEEEVGRYLATLDEAARDVKLLRRQVAEKLGADYAQIFDAHLLILQDEALEAPTLKLIREERATAEYAFWQTLQGLRRQFDAIDDEYFRARKADILDIERRVLTKLCQHEGTSLAQMNPDSILFAHDLTPSDTAHMQRGDVLALVTEIGGTTSHAAIIARGLGIPAVLGVDSAIASAEPGVPVIVDGGRGWVFIDPDPETLERYQGEARRFREREKDLSASRVLLSETRDGIKVSLLGNIELPEEIEPAIAYGAEGIGLYRTEYLYLTGGRLPTEAEQTEAYSRLAERVAPHPLVIRTLDLGGDKLPLKSHATSETNPFLGWRAIRVSLSNKEIFRAQLRAILRATAKGNVRIMHPMISSVEEVIEANEVLEEARSELRSEGVPFNEDCLVGVMIEVPAAAVVADQLAEEVDFFSIGTNDLIQYTIAVDRSNERVAYLFDPFHPAVLRLIKKVVDAGHLQGIPVTLCGEMAADPWSSILLLGLGVDGFSMGPRALPEVKRAIRSVTIRQAAQVAEHVLSLKTREDIWNFMQEAIPVEVPRPAEGRVASEVGEGAVQGIGAGRHRLYREDVSP